jgi:hypothetical protein
MLAQNNQKLAVYWATGLLMFSGASQAITPAALLKSLVKDVSVVTAKGECASNPLDLDGNGNPVDPPCAPIVAACPKGKVIIPLQASKSCKALTTGGPVLRYEFSVEKTNSATKLECLPSINSHYDYDPDAGDGTFTPERLGFTPFCNINTKACKPIQYQVTARCVTKPAQEDLDKIGIE